MKSECPICIDKISNDNELILSCCNQKICKTCDSKNISDKCWICRQNIYRKTNDVSIYYDQYPENSGARRFLTTRIKNNIEDTNDAIQIGIIINSLFIDGCIFGEFNMIYLQDIENAIVKLKNVNYIIKIVNESMYPDVTCHNLLSLIIHRCIIGYMNGRPNNILTLLQAKSLLRISTNLINKNIDYKFMIRGEISIDDLCKYERNNYENDKNHKFCFYFYDKIIKYMNPQGEKKLAEASKFSFKKLFSCF